MFTPHQVRPALADAELLTSSNNEALIEEYLTWKKSYTRTAFETYRVWVERFQTFANKAPELLRHPDYVAFAHSIRDCYAPKCVQFALNIVHNYLRFFAEQGRLGFPLFLARVPKAIAKSHEAIAEEEYVRVVEMLRSEKKVQWRDLAMIMLLHDTGMRIGELLSLEIDDIEEDLSAVVRTEKNVNRRRVYWNEGTDEALQNYLVERVNRGPAETDALFVAQLGKWAKPMSKRSVQRILLKVFERASIRRKLSAHSFRHAFVHRLAKLGVPDAIIAQLVGHASPTSIAHYTKLSRPEYKEYAERQLAFAHQHNR